MKINRYSRNIFSANGNLKSGRPFLGILLGMGLNVVIIELMDLMPGGWTDADIIILYYFVPLLIGFVAGFIAKRNPILIGLFVNLVPIESGFHHSEWPLIFLATTSLGILGAYLGVVSQKQIINT